ncbi:MAG: hypothetical protein KC457_31935 [Myxococcales bacterium]|nr:hypothetical protein [Myxococcales bacterium]
MVVFNGYAVIVAILIALIAVPLNWLAPSLLDGQYGDLVLASIAFVVSGIAEPIGLKARIFWLPIWLWSLVIATYQLYQLWGVAGLVGGLVLVGGAIAGLIVLIRKNELQEWARAPQELVLARSMADNLESRQQCFTHLDAAFINLLLVKETPQMWAHQRELLATLRPLLGNGLDPEKVAAIERLDQAYAAKISDPEAELDNDDVSAVHELIQLHLE